MYLESKHFELFDLHPVNDMRMPTFYLFDNAQNIVCQPKLEIKFLISWISKILG